jgi:hypothetical protein
MKILKAMFDKYTEYFMLQNRKCHHAVKSNEECFARIYSLNLINSVVCRVFSLMSALK